MSFFGNIFKKKPGGTGLGNLIRGVVSKATGGALGTGKGIISQQDYDKKILPDVEYYSRYGQTKNGVVLPEYTSTAQIQPQVNTTTADPITEIKKSVVMTWVKSNWYFLVLPFGLVLYGVYTMIKKIK